MTKIVVIPAKNEANGIGELVRRCLRYADVVMVANDSSTDATAFEADQAGAMVVDVPSWREGLRGVYRYGVMTAMDYTRKGDPYICELDAGGSHDPDSLPAFWYALDHGYDVAFGSRFLPGATCASPWRRRWLSWVGTRLTNWMKGTRFTDATSGYIAYRWSALSRMQEMGGGFVSKGHYYQTEVRLKARGADLLTIELPIRYKSSSSSLNWRSIREALWLTFFG